MRQAFFSIQKGKTSDPLKIANLVIALFCAGVFFTSGSVSYAAGENQGRNIPLKASAAVDKATIHIGDKITYTITVRAPKDIEVEFPQILPENLAEFAIKDFGSQDTAWCNKKTYTHWYLLTTYTSAEHVIPAAVIKYRKKGSSEWQESSTNGVKVEVKSLLGDVATQADIRDIKVPKSFHSKIWLYVLLGCIALLIPVAVFVFMLLKRKQGARNAPLLLAHIIAYEALAAFEKKDYIGKGQTKAYYIELSDIVRHYLENRFSIRAPEMTTEEFLLKVKEESALLLEHKGLLRDFLLNCDLVKFAKYQPAEQEANLSLASAKRLIDQTKEEKTS